MFLIVLMLLVSIFMILVVLVQRGRGGGLSGAFGSGGGSNSAFGTKTGDVFTTITVVAFVIFMLLAIALAFQFRNASGIAPATGPVIQDAGATTRPLTVMPGAGTEPSSTRVAPELPTTPATPATRPGPATSAPATRP